MDHDEPQSRARSAFVTTRWTQVLRARGGSEEARAALSDLCQVYYDPVLTFIRQHIRNADTASDLTQEFFAQLLARHGLNTVEPGHGRFRSFLLGAVKHFLASQYDHDQAGKRGGGHELLALEARTDTSGAFQIPDPSGPVPDSYFDRQWALTLVQRALDLLAVEHKQAEKMNQFERLKPWLVGNVESLSQAQAAQALGISEGAVKVAIHRLRKRFRELVKSEIAQTVEGDSQIDTELHYLLEVLSQTY